MYELFKTNLSCKHSKIYSKHTSPESNYTWMFSKEKKKQISLKISKIQKLLYLGVFLKATFTQNTKVTKLSVVFLTC